jgi:fructokinase
MSLRFGLDLGGTKIEIIALDARGHTLLRRRIATPAGDYEQAVRALAELVHAAEQELGAQGSVGVGIPGALSPASGLIKNANSTCLIGHTLDRDLSTALQRPVRLSNDANCFALSEAADGAGAGYAVVFGVILGTGVGGGVVVHGQVLNGANAIGGEWGHNPLPWPRDDERPDPACYCGKQGCLETWLSGSGLAGAYARRGGKDADARVIAARAADGEVLAQQVLDDYVDRLARGLATVINVLDPDIIVLGGGVSNLEYLYTRVPQVWGAYVFSDYVDTRLARAYHGDSSGVRGAAWLWPT